MWKPYEKPKEILVKPFLTLFVGLILFNSNCFAQVQTASSYLDVSSPAGGPIITGDILEIRGIISIPSGTTVTGLTYTSLVPGGTAYQAGTLEAITNEGVVVGAIPNTGVYTDAVGDDRGQIVGSAVTIYMGTGATSAAGGTLVGGTTTPVFYNSQSIIMAAFRVKVTGAVGATILVKGTFNYLIGGVPTTATLATISVGVLQYAGCSSVGPTDFMTNETNGTFGSGIVQNRAAASANVTGFTFIVLSANQPTDGDYSIVKNTSPTQYTGGAPAGTDRVFGVWDIIGDHSGTMTGAGNPPAANGANGGYMLAVNGSYAPSSVFTTTVVGLTANTEYIMSFWLYNLCSKCGADPASNASSGTPGVKPNLAFAIGGFDYYNTGEIAYTGKWVQYSLTFANGAGTSLPINIRNNAPGGGGNDWAIDDITMTTCLNILPLTLISFEGSREPGGVVLNWQTEAEQNTSYFDVERRDENSNFISLGHVAANSLAAGGHYHFNDNTALPPGQTYYRLAIYDRDGKVSHSPIVIIDVKDAGMDSKTMNIAPNPAINNTTLYLMADAPGMVQIDLLNLAGSRVYSQTYSVSKGQNALPIRSIERLMKGLYIVRMVSGSQTACTKLLVE
jgi:hypothetical protein